MKIAWISYYPLDPKEHAAPWIMTLAEEVVREGHQLTIVTVSSKVKEIRRFNSEAGYEVVVIPFKGGIFHLLGMFNTRINSLKRFLMDFQKEVDVIHIHGTEHQFASSFLRVHSKTPFIISVQGIISLYKLELKRKLSSLYLFWAISSFYERNEIKKSTHFFCRTDWDQKFVRSINIDAEINLSWEMIRGEFFDYSHNFEGQGILFMGGKGFLKALDICLRTFDQLLENNLFKLHVVGNCDRKDIESIKKKYALKNITEENLIIYGKLNAKQICDVYQSCFCLYHPSLIDNSPNSVCEAQVAGLPVVATNVGGVSSLIVDGETGILVHKNNVREHGDSILSLYKKDEFKKYLSAGAAKIARARHDKNVILGQTISAYRKLANQFV
jgi:glycosyltransferase involved in cell wall biosynthesis